MNPAPAPSRASPETPATPVRKIGPGDLFAAADRLVGPGAGSSAIAGRRFLESVRTLGIDISCMWGVPDASGRGFSQVCLAVPGSGKTAMLFLSPDEVHPDHDQGPGRASPADRSSTRLDGRVALLRAVGDELTGLRDHQSGERRVVLLQALLEEHEAGALDALGVAGFTRLGDLAYLRRPLRKATASGQPSWPPGIEVRRLSELPEDARTPALLRALERSYIDTLDCPELCGMRRVPDVLDSHYSVGVFDPALWWIVVDRGEAEGCMLLSPCPEQQLIELVYLGLSPTMRGRGIGASLLTLAFTHVARRPERSMTCAVDLRNHPAMRLYRSAGFQQFSTRIPMVKPLP
jgi:ribosomal protein S18 acetylase RimI-like enzyme